MAPVRACGGSGSARPLRCPANALPIADRDTVPVVPESTRALTGAKWAGVKGVFPRLLGPYARLRPAMLGRETD